MRVFNFAAGPAALPLEVLEQARDEMTDWRGSGMSVMEISHRSKAFLTVATEAEADLRELLAIPGDYKVLFMQGGATAQFAAIPMNLAQADSGVDYVNTGSWSKKALGEARHYCKVNVAADSAASNYTSVPPRSDWKLTPGRRICTTRPTRPSAVSSFRSCRRSMRRWWPTCPRPSCRGRSMSAASA